MNGSVIWLSKDMVFIEVADARILLDLITSDGYLDSIDVAAARRVAEAAGREPNSVTPSGFMNQYPHALSEATRRDYTTGKPVKYCRTCYGTVDLPVHSDYL